MKIAAAILVLYECSLWSGSSIGAGVVVDAFVRATMPSKNAAWKHMQMERLVVCLAAAKPLANEGDWSAYLDEEGTGFVYYFNAKTGDSLWDKPTLSFPDILLDDATKRIAIEKQEAYIQSTTQQQQFVDDQQNQQQLDKSSSVNGDSSKSIEKTEKDWFGSIFEQQSETPLVASTVADEGILDKNVEKVDEINSSSRSGKTDAPKENSMSSFFGSLFSIAADTVSSSAPTGTDGNGPSSTEAPPPQTTTTQNDTVEPLSSGEVFDNLFGGMFKAADVMNNEKELIEVPVKIQSASFVMPHPEKILWGGEDAVFIKGRTFGLFDGVSSAIKAQGVPLYSKTLAKEMKKIVKENVPMTLPELTESLTYCKDIADATATGASTAVVASIGNDGSLRVLNVGDATCIVIRNGKVVTETKETIHYFECPFQLSTDSPDLPKRGSKLTFKLQRGDLIFMASDGVFDNLSNKQVADLVTSEIQSKNTAIGLGIIAKRVTELSRKISLDENAPTPYAVLARKFKDPDYASGLGGKVDDTSCVVVSYS